MVKRLIPYIIALAPALLLVSAAEAQEPITVCKGEYALCWASTCTPLVDGTGQPVQIQVNNGNSFPAASCLCPVLKGPAFADLTGGNMQGSCDPPGKTEVWSLFFPKIRLPQEVFDWSTEPIKIQECKASLGLGDKSVNCFSFLCTKIGKINGVPIADCTCPIGESIAGQPLPPATLFFTGAGQVDDSCAMYPVSLPLKAAGPPLEGHVTNFSGIAHGAGRGSMRTGISIVGTFLLSGGLDLSAVPSIVTIRSLLNDGTSDVMGLPVTLIGDPRNNAKTAYFTAAGSDPTAKVTIGAQGGGSFTFRVEVSRATSAPPDQCPHPTLLTTFEIRDGVNPPVTVSAQEPWVCFGPGNADLKSERHHVH